MYCVNIVSAVINILTSQYKKTADWRSFCYAVPHSAPAGLGIILRLRSFDGS